MRCNQSQRTQTKMLDIESGKVTFFRLRVDSLDDDPTKPSRYPILNIRVKIEVLIH